MDRDKRWERVEKSYRAMVYGEGPQYAGSDAGDRGILCARSVYDEFVVPTVIVDEDGEPVATDRIRRCGHLLQLPSGPGDSAVARVHERRFPRFDRGPGRPKDLYFVCMTLFSETCRRVRCIQAERSG